MVLLHDADVERTTDGSGPVAGLSYRELVALDAGHRFTPDAGRSFPYRGRGQREPRLQDLLRA